MIGRRKKILHVVWSFNNGGIETMLVNIANHQCDENEVGVMIVNNSCDKNLLSTLSPDVHVFCIGRPIASKNPYYYAKLNYLYRCFAPDIVHFHQLTLSKIFIKRNNDKWFFTQHCIPVSFIPNKNITTYIAISQCVKDAMMSLSPIDNCVVCYNGVDFARIVEKDSWNNGTQLMKIISVARLDIKIKGQDTIVEAVKKLPKEIRQKCIVDIYGDGPDKYLLEELIKKNGLENTIHLKGNINNKQLLLMLKDYDISIHASRIEGFGLSAVESMGCGLPVILSQILGHMEISQERISFISDNAEDLSHKIAYSINNYNEIRKLSLKNRRYVTSRFSIQKMVENLNTIYNVN